MPELTGEDLKNTLLKVLGTLGDLERTAIGSQERNSKRIFTSHKVFEENLPIIQDITAYINDILKNEDFSGLDSAGRDCTKKIIDDLADLKTQDPKKKEIIEDLIDQFTNHDDVYSVIYTGLKKLELEVMFSKFVASKHGKEAIERTTSYIKETPVHDPRMEDMVKKEIISRLSSLMAATGDKKKKALIESLKKELELDSLILEPKELNLNRITLTSGDLREINSDWERFLDPHAKVIVKVGETKAASLEALKTQVNELLLNSNVDQHPELTFSGSTSSSSGHKITEQNPIIYKLLRELKQVNLCGTDQFREIHGFMVSDNPRNPQPIYTFTKLTNGNIQVDFQCNGQAAKPGSLDIKTGLIMARAIFNPNTGELEINRRFNERKLTTAPSLTLKKKRR